MDMDRLIQEWDEPGKYFLKTYVLTKRNISRGVYNGVWNYQDLSDSAVAVMNRGVVPAEKLPACGESAWNPSFTYLLLPSPIWQSKHSAKDSAH